MACIAGVLRRRRLTAASRCWLLAAMCAVSALHAACQIAPDDDLPVADRARVTALAAAPNPPGMAARAQILGWSLQSEEDVAQASHGEGVTLEAGHPEVIVFYSTVAAAPDAEFRYRLQGYDPAWTVTQQRLAHYRRLPPGRYSFQVEARRPGQPWSASAVAALPIQQQPFFFQTWYAAVLVGSAGLVLAWQLLQQRDQLLKGQMGMVLQERNRIANECHDTLMAGFAAISWQSEATGNLIREAVGADHPAALSCDLARSMVAHCQAEARRIIWDLRDSDEITDSLSRALLEATVAQRERDTPRTTLDVHGLEIPIAPGAVHHLVCIGQEAVANAVRHGRPATIRIALTYGDELLQLSVHDDGRGFQVGDRAVRAGHFGIPVMEERARKLGGTLHLVSAPGRGTEVSVTVSFHRIHQPAVKQQHIVKWIGV